VEPHAINEYVIQLSPTSNVFKEGHRIRVEISSSNFPKIARNPNTGAPIGSSAELQPALQTVLHDGSHPSYILLPVVPR
jgi:putative CocE/NonD family hydrolase